MDRNQQAFILWESDQKEEAIKLLLEEIEAAPNQPDAYINLGTMFMIAQRYDDAEAIFDVGLEKNTDKEDLLYCFGNLYYEQGEYEKAIIQYEASAKESRIAPDSYFMIGMSYQALGDLKKALAYLLKAIDENPEEAEYLMTAADILMSMEHFKEAEVYYDGAIHLDETLQEGFFKRGLVGMVLAEEQEQIDSLFAIAKELDEEAFAIQLEQIKQIESFLKAQE